MHIINDRSAQVSLWTHSSIGVTTERAAKGAFRLIKLEAALIGLFRIATATVEVSWPPHTLRDGGDT